MDVKRVLLLLSAAVMASSYESDIQQYRKQSEERLKSDTGWLAVAGLFWLQPGRNPVGTAESATVRLPDGAAAASVGNLFFEAGKVSLTTASGQTVLVNGKPATSATLQSDENGATPDVVKINDRLNFFIIKRGERWAVRLRDLESPMRKEFTHKTWFPIKPEYRVEARWEAYAPGKTMPVPNILNETENLPAPGKAIFTLNGQEWSLEPVLEGNQLFFIFRDKTAGKETYTPGRFFYTELPKDGKVILDFNKAYNPPCAFTPFATCPLPPKQNQLAVRIEAGELKYGDH